MSNASDNGKGKGKAIEESDEGQGPQQEEEQEEIYDSDEDESLHCAICLSVIDNRTVVQPCMHDAYCFVCILAWSQQSRRCPLCVGPIEACLVHSIRSERDFQRHYLPPLPVKSD